MTTVKQHYQVAVPVPLLKKFTYSWKDASISPGTRVLVPFAGRKLVGVVTTETPKPTEKFRIREILKPVEQSPIYSPELLELGEWLSHYYHHPIGEVLKAMIPQRDAKAFKKKLALNNNAAISLAERELLLKLFGKKRELTELTIQKKYKALLNSGEKLPTIRELLKKEILLEVFENKKPIVLQEFSDKEGYDPEPPQKLTDEQSKALELFIEKTRPIKPWKPFLLHGVTGSGKTEVYLHMIARTLEQQSSAQILVLVPEISLTPQMTGVFETRFPGKVCAIHSAMPENHRFEQVLKMQKGEKQILIGPRSAVFVPFKNLELILVDEEHDGSYKQATQFSYHGRDVALVRAQKKKIPIVLGSATPAAETYWKAKSGHYHLLELKQRVLKQALPTVVLKETSTKLKGEVIKDGKIGEAKASEAEENMIDPEIIQALKANHAKGNQSIVIVNRRGYAFYLFDLVTKKVVTCSKCSVSLTLHNQMKNLSCHYCQSFSSTKKTIEKTGHTYAAIGYGSQKAELFLQQQLPRANIVRLDSDTARNRDNLSSILDDFRQEKIDILVGTQILAKGHDFPKVTLVVLLEVDKHLNLPDFRSGERTFQLMVQAAGRSGRSGSDGQVMIQTLNQENKIIQEAAHHDYLSFIEDELKFREKYSYPPFSKLALLEFSSTNENLIESYCKQLSDWIDSFFETEESPFKGLSLQGPYSPGLHKLKNRWRKHLLIKSKQIKVLHQFIETFIAGDQNRPEEIRLKIDIDPQSLL